MTRKTKIERIGAMPSLGQLRTLGETLCVPDLGCTVIIGNKDKTKAQVGRLIRTRRELGRKALAVITSFSAVEHAQAELVAHLAVKDPTVVLVMYNAIKSDGPKAGVVLALLRQYIKNKTDIDLIVELGRLTNKAKEFRDRLAHSLWYAIHGHPECIALVDPRGLLEDEAARKSFVIDALNKGADPNGMIGPLPAGTAMRDALLLKARHCENALAINVALQWSWRLAHTLAPGEESELQDQVRGILRARVGVNRRGKKPRSRREDR